MESLTRDEITARVVAWHNRHPLARHITPAQVDGIGLVALPFGLSARWGRPGRERPAFREDFAPPLPRWRIARFAAAHATPERPGAPDWPVREIERARSVGARRPPTPDTLAGDTGLGTGLDTGTDSGMDATPGTVRYLVTASIEAQGRRRRVLLAPVGSQRIIGPRVWGPARLAGGVGAALTTVLGVALGVWWGLPPAAPSPAAHTPHPQVQAQQIQAQPAQSAQALAPQAPSSPAPHVAAAQAPQPQGETREHAEPAGVNTPLAAASAAPAAPTPAASAAASDAPAAGTATVAASAPNLPPDIRPVLRDEDRLAARRESAAARSQGLVAARAASRPAPSAFYALTATPLPQRVLAQAKLTRMRVALAAVPTPIAAQTRLFEVQGRWQAAWWPLFDRDSALRAQALLARQGVRVEVVAF